MQLTEEWGWNRRYGKTVKHSGELQVSSAGHVMYWKNIQVTVTEQTKLKDSSAVHQYTEFIEFVLWY